MTDSFRVLLRPQPDEMTFDQVVKHVERAMFWDPVDGTWNDIAFLERDRWDLLSGQLKSAHEREVEELRETIVDLVGLSSRVMAEWWLELEGGGMDSQTPNGEIKECQYELDRIVARLDEPGIDVRDG